MVCCSMQAVRDPVKPASVYLRAAHRIGTRDVISVVPGHWIDCQGDSGAPGEREFNQEVCGPHIRFLFGGR